MDSDKERMEAVLAIAKARLKRRLDYSAPDCIVNPVSVACRFIRYQLCFAPHMYMWIYKTRSRAVTTRAMAALDHLATRDENSLHLLNRMTAPMHCRIVSMHPAGQEEGIRLYLTATEAASVSLITGFVDRRHGLTVMVALEALNLVLLPFLRGQASALHMTDMRYLDLHQADGEAGVENLIEAWCTESAAAKLQGFEMVVEDVGAVIEGIFDVGTKLHVG